MEKVMFVRILCLLLACGPMVSSLDAGWFDSLTSYFRSPPLAKPPKIRVLIVHDQQGVIVEVKGKYKIYDPHTGDHLSTRFVGKRKFMQPIRDGLKWGEEFPGLYQLMIVPDEASTTTIVDGIEYSGPIFVYDIGGTISVINEVPIETFLSSTLAQRYRQSMSEELLASIAIVARTNAYYASANPKNQFWSVDATPAGYHGYAAVDSTSAIEKAIAETRHMVMTLSSGNGTDPIQAFPAEWKTEGALPGQSFVSQITLDQAAEMAKQGAHAAQILAKAFPGSKIELVHYSSEKK
jgi:stage II sporulation protein D